MSDVSAAGAQETKAAAAGAPSSPSMDQMVIDIVFPVLQAKVPGTKLEKTALKMSADREGQIKLRSLQNDIVGLRDAMFFWISMSDGFAVVDNGVVHSVADEVAIAVKEAVCQASTSPLKLMDRKLLDRLEFAFTKLEYRGDACTSFRAYLNRCWEEYSSRPDAYKAPYLSIVQSSGFGKSRLLQELAQVTSKEKGGTARVMYVCVRRELSTGYPQATLNLHEWLFADSETEDAMTSRLEVIYYYAQQNWEAVGANWLALFTTPQADLTMANALKAAEREWKSSNTTQSVANRVVVLVVDEARSLLTERPGRINKFRMLRHALKDATRNIRRRFGNGGIVAVLVDTNSRVADFTPSLANEPSSRMDHNDPPFTLFPPFVLAHTMDVHWQHGAQTNDFSGYKDAVLGSTNTKAWKHLISMGRPLWKSTFESSMDQSNDEDKATERVLALAARKLLLGGDPLSAKNYNETTMLGVASMLCRLGLRPYSTASLASRAVADFMAILAYVDYENDGHVSSYSSDPVLALGATQVWYANDTALSNHLLPQLNKLLLNETLDVGEVGEVLARIILLLVMDTCVVKMEKSQSHRDCQFSGQLVDVQLFMEALVGSNPTVKMERQKVADQKTQDAFETWRAQWKGWQVGFCHFVQLFSEPTEEMLWMLLGRRAAGVFPRNQSGADLVIPILHQGQRKVSLILIQVKNVAGHDSGFPKTATVKMNPSYVFSKENTLSKKPLSDVIRVYMSLREAEEQFIRYGLVEVKPKSEHAKQANALDSRGGSKTVTSAAQQKVTSQKRRSQRNQQKAKADPNNAPSNADGEQKTPTTEKVHAFTLCIRSMKPWALSRHNASLSPIPEAVAIVNKLVMMATPLWEPIVLARGNLRARAEMEKNTKDTNSEPRLSRVMPDLDLLQAAQRALLHGTLGGKNVEDEEKVAPQIGQSVSSAPTDEPSRKRRRTR